MTSLRRRFALMLRTKVAGPHTDELLRTVYTAPGERWFDPDDPICRVHDDAAMFVGGLRALLLQALHPLAMAGVAGHSGYRSDPWGRLQRTNHYLGVTTFGTAEAAEALVDRINDVHQRVRGKAEDGRPYRASDPHLLAWIHLAEAESFLVAHQRYGARPRLTPEQADRYVAQLGQVSARLGVLAPPTTVAELQDALDAFRPELTATEACRDTVRFLLAEPPLTGIARPGYLMLAAGALATLPVWVRRELGLPTLGRLTPVVDALVGRPLGSLATATVRWALEEPSLLHERRRRAMALALRG